MGQKSAVEEWSALAAAVADRGGGAFAPLPEADLRRLEETYSLDEGIRELLDEGWPTSPVVVEGGGSFFLPPRELTRHAEETPGWREGWFPLGFGHDDGTALFLDEDEEGIWDIYVGDELEGVFASEQIYRSLGAFVCAVRLSFEWVRPENLEAQTRGWFLFRERRLTLTIDAAEKLARAYAPYFRDGPALLPGCGRYATLLDPPLDRIATPLAERE